MTSAASPVRPGRRAAFLDRDGTLIVDREYLGDAAGVELLPGVADAIARLARAGIPSIVVTNQSGIARGLISLEGARAVRLRVDELLREQGAALLDTLTCPHHPDFDGPCACRKPGVALYERAAALHRIDLSRSLYIGDRDRDVAAARAFGGRAYLVPSPHTAPHEEAAALAGGAVKAASLAAAVDDALRTP